MAKKSLFSCLLPREDIAATWQKDYEAMRSSMIHGSVPMWAELIENISILQNNVRNNSAIHNS
ncbi:MAG: hypothetical protein J6U94_06905 [Paludibacteraceae bacterium]|nr:hypothetical protein [Paludibacteraceae bacterium]